MVGSRASPPAAIWGHTELWRGPEHHPQLGCGVTPIRGGIQIITRSSIVSGRMSIHPGRAASSSVADAGFPRDAAALSRNPSRLPLSSDPGFPACASVSFPAATWLAVSCAGPRPEMPAGPGAAQDLQLSPEDLSSPSSWMGLAGGGSEGGQRALGDALSVAPSARQRWMESRQTQAAWQLGPPRVGGGLTRLATTGDNPQALLLRVGWTWVGGPRLVLVRPFPGDGGPRRRDIPQQKRPQTWSPT